MKKLVVLFFLCLNSGFIIGQTRPVIKRTDVPELIGTPEVKSQPEQSEYLGYEALIKEVLIDEASLKEVPKKQLNQSKEDYLKTLNNWVVANGHLVRQEKRSVEFH